MEDLIKTISRSQSTPLTLVQTSKLVSSANGDFRKAINELAVMTDPMELLEKTQKDAEYVAGKLSPRSTKCTPLHCSLSQIFV